MINEPLGIIVHHQDEGCHKITAIIKVDINFKRMIKTQYKKTMTVYRNSSFQDFTFTRILPCSS